MKISTSHSYSGGPYAWSAIDDDTYDGAEDSDSRHMIGYGATRDEAITDLLRLLEERAEYEQEKIADLLRLGEREDGTC